VTQASNKQTLELAQQTLPQAWAAAQQLPLTHTSPGHWPLVVHWVPPPPPVPLPPPVEVPPPVALPPPALPPPPPLCVPPPPPPTVTLEPHWQPARRDINETATQRRRPERVIRGR
jgi:hypothetical protein